MVNAISVTTDSWQITTILVVLNNHFVKFIGSVGQEF